MTRRDPGEIPQYRRLRRLRLALDGFRERRRDLWRDAVTSDHLIGRDCHVYMIGRRIGRGRMNEHDWRQMP